jgi:glycosyltransferase involved in cell wall biosynthesis
LHPRFRFRPFIWLHQQELRAARRIYTRVPEAALALTRAGLTCHLEVHDVAKLGAETLLERVVQAHDEGRIGWLIPISRAARDRLVEAGADPARIHVAPSGVNTEAFGNVRAFDPAQLDQPRLVYIGRLSADHGLAVLQHLASRPHLTVTAVGAAESGEKDVIERVGMVAHREVPGWYDRAQIAVMPYQPSLGHAASISPIKLFEAMAAGRPIVISDLPTIREIVEHERHALLVDPLDHGAWVHAVERLRNDRGLAARLASEARRHVAQYAWTERARGILDRLGPGGVSIA